MGSNMKAPPGSSDWAGERRGGLVVLEPDAPGQGRSARARQGLVKRILAIAAIALALSVVAIAGSHLVTERPRPPASVRPAFVQAGAFATGHHTESTTLSLHRAVGRGDLLVGWFAEYGAPGQVRVSDSVNGAWKRADQSLTLQNDGGDIALYYRENSGAARGGITVTVAAALATYIEGTVAEYSGLARAGSIDQMIVARGVGAAVDTGPTASVAAGDLVFAGVLTGRGTVSVSPGSSKGVAFNPRSRTSTGSAYEQDILSAAAGSQDGTASLSSATDWYAVCIAFRRLALNETGPPTVPGGLRAKSIASTRVILSWSPSTDSERTSGYTVFRNGSTVGTVHSAATWFVDSTAAASTRYDYAVDAFNTAGNHSARSSPTRVVTPARSPAFVQGVATSTGTRISSLDIRLPGAVDSGDLLVGWFGQYGAAGKVEVSDSVNGPWTRSVSEPFLDGSGDVALYYRQNSGAAPSGLVVTVSASEPGYLQAVAGEFRHVATTAALDQAVVADGNNPAADTGPTPLVAGGEVVVASVITGCQPGSDTPGQSHSVPFVLDVTNGSGSSVMEDILSGAAGRQEGRLIIHRHCDWYAVVATFRHG
jgi:hypothetical protein